MPLKYTILPDIEMIITRYLGDVTVEEILENLRTQFEDKRYPVCKTSLTVMSGCNLMIAKNDWQKVAALMRSYSAVETVVRAAIVVSDPRQTAYVELFRNNMQASKVHYRTLTSMEGAFDFLLLHEEVQRVKETLNSLI